MWSHNTGKTRTILEKLWWIGNEYPGARILFVRLERTRITRSVLVTWERDVVPRGHPCLKGATREHRKSYRLPNGTEYIIVGAEDSESLYSVEADIIYWNEIVELPNAEPWQRLHRALRSGPVPFRQLIADTNPSVPNHWILKRCATGLTRRIITRHTDNPYLYDAAAKRWTANGDEYLRRNDRALVGTDHKRLFEGIWCVGEGAFFPEFSEEIHCIPRPPQIESVEGRARYDWKKLCIRHGDEPVRIKWYAAGMDFGTRSPGCLTVFGFDDSRRAFRVAEIYRAGKSPDWWADRIVEVMREFNEPASPFRAVIADHAEAAPGGQIDTMNRRLGIAGLPRIVRPCVKDYEAACGVMRDALRHDDPKLFLTRGSGRYGRDEDNDSRGLPCSLEEELLALRYPDRIDKPHRAKDEQHDQSLQDHAFDAARYVLDWAWLRDLSAAPAVQHVPDDKPGSWGAVMGHAEAMRAARENFG